jgi:energy-coupling factor transporter ATP-binding protein EcfA2
MHQPRGTFFGETEKMLARALYDAGQTDTEIGLGIGVSVNNIIHWRREEDLQEHLPPEREADVYVPPVKREPVRAVRPATGPGAPLAAGRPEGASSITAPSIRDPRLLSPVEAVTAYAAPVQPTGDNALEIGLNMDRPVFVDLEELLTTRLLIQGNSGSGKSHLLRRLLEESTGIVQQVIIDPEGDFAGFGETFGHTVVDANRYSPTKLIAIASKARELRGSVVLTLEGMEIDQQMDAVSAFLAGLFDADPAHWHPALVVVDEAHLFAPATDNGEDKQTRKASQQAMANLMSRGRKRGLAGVIATQRLSKLHKNVAAEASNFLIGRTFLDIDIARAADLLGLSRADSEQVRSLSRGEFLGLGPAIARRPLKVKVGAVTTLGKAGPERGLTPLPMLRADEMQSLMPPPDDEDDRPAAPALRIVK